MIGIYTDLFSSEMESVLAMVHGLELVMVAQVWVPPQSAVDHMGQTLLGPNLTQIRILGKFKLTSRNGLEVAKVGQIADRWLIGLMVDRSNSERLRGFCNRQADRRTFAILESLSRLKIDSEDS